MTIAEKMRCDYMAGNYSRPLALDLDNLIAEVAERGIEKFIPLAFTWMVTFASQVDLRNIDMAKEKFREAMQQHKWWEEQV